MKPQLTPHESPGRRERQHCAPIVLAAVVLLAGPTVSAGQTPVLERVVRADHLGAPVVWVPDSIDSGLFARRVAQGARAPLVFEAAFDVSSGASPTRLDLTGLTVRAALDALVATDPRYEWRLVGDTIVVRPVGAWEDSGHPFHGLAGSELPGEQPLAEALRRIVGGVTEAPDIVALAARVDRGRRVRSRTVPGAMLDRVSELADEADLFVQVTDARSTTAAVLEVSTWEGQGYRIAGPRRSTAPGEASQ